MRIRSSAIHTIYDFYILVMLILSTGAFTTLLAGSSDPAVVVAGSPISRFAWGCFYLISLARNIKNRHSAWMNIRANPALVMFVALIIGSTLWSVSPGASVHAWAILLLSASIALDISITYSPEEQLALVWKALTAIVVLSVIVEIIAPGLTPTVGAPGETGWHGVFPTKNDFGKILVIAAAAWLAMPLRLRFARPVAVCAALVLARLANAAGSSISIVEIAAIAVFLPVLRWKDKPRAVAGIILVSVTLALGYAAYVQLPALTAAVGRNANLTGRVGLWRYSFEYIAQRPISGYGFGAFWSSTSESATRIREAIDWGDAPHSHDQYIEILLGLGVTGLCLYLVTLAKLTGRSLRYYLAGREGHRRWPLLLLAIVWFTYFTETGVINGNGTLWILLCTLAFSHRAMTRGSQQLPVNQNGEMSVAAPTRMAR